MAFETSGSLMTDKQTIETAFAWNTQTEWEAFQSKNNIVIESGILKLAQTFPTTDLVHHYDVTDLAGSDGDPISNLPDKIGSADLSQATSSKQPFLQTNEIGGNQVLRFDGSSDGLTSPVFSTELFEPTTIFIVSRLVNVDTSTNNYLLGTDNSNKRKDFLVDNDGAGGWDMFATQGIDVTGADTNSHIWGLLYDGASSTAREDGIQVASGNPGSDSYESISLGWLAWNNANYVAVDVGEIMIYDADLSTSDVNSVESYLSDKWGITI